MDSKGFKVDGEINEDVRFLGNTSLPGDFGPGPRGRESPVCVEVSRVRGGKPPRPPVPPDGGAVSSQPPVDWVSDPPVTPTILDLG